MKYKKIMLILITAIFLVSIAGVCAADANDTIVTSEDNMEIDQTTDDAIGVGEDTDLASSDENEILNDGEQSFSKLNETINGNTNKSICLNGNYKYSSGDDSFKGGVVINRDVNIYGNGATIDGNEEARIFQINGGNVVFYNITFVNGNAGNQPGDNGGAINGNCKAINCTFKQNQAFDGGAMHSGSVVNCNFYGNTANQDGAAMYGGSAVNCNFTNNTANAVGGAMQFGSAVNCTFTDNHAGPSGGAMWGGSAVNCTFSGNTAELNGGAMYGGYKLNCIGQDPNDYYGTEELVLSWNANDFTTIYGSGEKLPIGLSINFINYDVVIYKDGSKVRTYHCLSNDKLAIDLLPGIYTAELTVTYPGITQPEPINITLTVTDGTTFWDLNKAINDNANDTITLDRDYAFNSTTDSAFIGGIEINRPVTINGNGHALDGKCQACIFYVRGNNVTINNITFVNGKYATDGGAIFWSGDNGAVSGSSFIGNNASGNGGAICWYGENGTVSDSRFIGNNASGNGGAIFWGAVNGNVSNSIFINNAANSEGDAIYGNRYLIADYCWFGGNATNYLDLPIAQAAYCNYILFLNATANPNEVPAFNTSEIVFKLYLYNKTSTTGDISEYDNTRLLPINLTITSTNGDVDIHTVNLGDSIRYTATGVGDASVTATIENAAYTIALNNIMANPNLSVENQVVTYGENATIALNYIPNATGKVNITLTGKKGTFTYTNLDLNATIMLPKDIPADEYNVTVSYSGDVNFFNATANATLTVNKANSTLTINDNVTFDYNTNGSTTVSYTHATGVNASVVGQPNAIVVVNDTTITVSGLNAGNYTLTVTTITDANHNNVTKNATITVNKAKTQLTANAITATYNVNKDLVITLKDANGNALSGVSVIVDLNGAKTYTTDSNGQVKVSTSGLVPKVYTATITFDGDNKYIKSTSSVKVTVNKAKPKIVAKKKTYKAKKKTKKFTITLKDNKNKPIKNAKVRLIVKKIKKTSKKKKSKKSKKKYKPNIVKTNKKGKATFKVKRFKKGTYQAKIIYKGNNYYTKVTKTVKIKLK